MARQHVFVFGASGNVGREFISTVLDQDTAENHENPTVIAGVADSENFLFNEHGLHSPGNKQIVEQLTATREKTKALLAERGKPFETPNDVLAAIKESGMDGEIIFVDASSGNEEMRVFHHEVITNSDCSIVTANKNPLALGDQDEYETLTEEPHRYGRSATVMAGNAPLPAIQRSLTTLDPTLNIEACLNGTLTYTFWQFNTTDKSFSECFREAEARGYTESDPRDDVNGVDPARKLVILAREGGWDVEYDDVDIDQFLPDKVLKKEGDEFWKALEAFDEEMDKKRERAREHGYHIFPIAEMIVEDDTPKLRIRLKEDIDSKNPMHGLTGTKNCCLVETELYKRGEESDDRIEAFAPGAGVDRTANTLRDDVGKMVRRKSTMRQGARQILAKKRASEPPSS